MAVIGTQPTDRPSWYTAAIAEESGLWVAPSRQPWSAAFAASAALSHVAIEHARDDRPRRPGRDLDDRLAEPRLHGRAGCPRSDPLPKIKDGGPPGHCDLQGQFVTRNASDGSHSRSTLAQNFGGPSALSRVFARDCVRALQELQARSRPRSAS
jgi:hypothetical protein